MKKLLIINKSFEFGGIQSALVNLLEEISTEYQIDLAVFNNNGPFKAAVPENVHLLPLHPMVQVLGMTNQNTKDYGSPLQRAAKLLLSIWSKAAGNYIPVSFLLGFQKETGPYDAVIAYHQETSAKTLVTGFGRFALEKCTAAQKIAWVHADIIKTGLGTKRNHDTYRRFDKIVCVSEACRASFLTAFPDLADKTLCCPNAVPAQKILAKAQAGTGILKPDNINIVSVGRLTAEKGFYEAAEALAPVMARNDRLRWYIIGSGTEEGRIAAFVKQHRLTDRIFLQGYAANPYPYIREADYLLVPSLHETFSMVTAEAHVLGTKVIARDIDIMHEVCSSNDIICDISADALGRIDWSKQDTSAAAYRSTISDFRKVIES